MSNQSIKNKSSLDKTQTYTCANEKGNAIIKTFINSDGTQSFDIYLKAQLCFQEHKNPKELMNVFRELLDYEGDE